MNTAVAYSLKAEYGQQHYNHFLCWGRCSERAFFPLLNFSLVCLSFFLLYLFLKRAPVIHLRRPDGGVGPQL